MIIKVQVSEVLQTAHTCGTSTAPEIEHLRAPRSPHAPFQLPLKGEPLS